VTEKEIPEDQRLRVCNPFEVQAIIAHPLTILLEKAGLKADEGVYVRVALAAQYALQEQGYIFIHDETKFGGALYASILYQYEKLLKEEEDARKGVYHE
jgi:hypothetical protein